MLSGNRLEDKNYYLPCLALVLLTYNKSSGLFTAAQLSNGRPEIFASFKTEHGIDEPDLHFCVLLHHTEDVIEILGDPFDEENILMTRVPDAPSELDQFIWGELNFGLEDGNYDERVQIHPKNA